MSGSNLYAFPASFERRSDPPQNVTSINRSYPPGSEFQRERYADSYCRELDRKRVAQKQRSVSDRIVLISLLAASAVMAAFAAYGVWELLHRAFAEVL